MQNQTLILNGLVGNIAIGHTIENLIKFIVRTLARAVIIWGDLLECLGKKLSMNENSTESVTKANTQTPSQIEETLSG